MKRLQSYTVKRLHTTTSYAMKEVTYNAKVTQLHSDHPATKKVHYLQTGVTFRVLRQDVGI